MFSSSAGEDYNTSLLTTLTFDQNDLDQYIHVGIIDDSYCEGQEKFYISLRSQSGGCRLLEDRLTVWIDDDVDDCK